MLATVLFVDIVNSTQALSSLGDRAWKTRPEDYYRILRSELVRYRGREANTAGDGLTAIFDGRVERSAVRSRSSLPRSP